MDLNYWKQKATPWVSAAVLVGGLCTAGILIFLLKIETGVNALNVPANVEDFSWTQE